MSTNCGSAFWHGSVDWVHKCCAVPQIASNPPMDTHSEEAVGQESQGHSLLVVTHRRSQGRESGAST